MTRAGGRDMAGGKETAMQVNSQWMKRGRALAVAAALGLACAFAGPARAQDSAMRPILA